MSRAQVQFVFLFLIVFFTHAVSTAALTNAPTTAKKNQTCVTSRRLPSMGAIFEVQVAHPCAAPLADKLFVNMQNQLDEIENEMSLYQKDSAISRLNREGQLMNAPAHLLRVLKKSLEMSKKTKGLFDVTVASIANGKSQVAVGWQNIIIKGDKISLAKPNVQVTFDGIAKGYAVDQVAETLEATAVASYLLNFSGNMRWRGHRPDGHFWRIQIWNPKTKIAQDIEPRFSGAIASSGAEHNGEHIFNPSQGKKTQTTWLQTTIVGPSAEICDALSTTVYLLRSKPEIDHLLAAGFEGYSSTQLAR